MRVTITDLALEWLGPVPVGRPVSAHWQATRVGLVRHLVFAIGERFVDELGVADLWEIQRYGLGVGLSVATVNKITHHILPAMLRDFEADAGRKCPRVHVEPGTRLALMKDAQKLQEDEDDSGRKHLEPDQRDAIIRAAHGHWYFPIVAFLFYSGLRIGEACALRQCDIEWRTRRCTVRRSRRGNQITPGKTKRSRRKIRLPRAAIAAIVSLRNDDEPEALLFRSPKGFPLNANNFRARHWNRLVARYGGPRITPHGCRHTMATIALESGKPIARVAAWLGNRQRTAEDVYSHVLAGDDWDEAVRAPARLRVAR